MKGRREANGSTKEKERKSERKLIKMRGKGEGAYKATLEGKKRRKGGREKIAKGRRKEGEGKKLGS